MKRKQTFWVLLFSEHFSAVDLKNKPFFHELVFTLALPHNAILDWLKLLLLLSRHFPVAIHASLRYRKKGQANIPCSVPTAAAAPPPSLLPLPSYFSSPCEDGLWLRQLPFTGLVVILLGVHTPSLPRLLEGGWYSRRKLDHETNLQV